MENNSRIFICYYNFDKEKNTCEWLLTDDKVLANQTDESFELANIEDLYHWVAATNQVFQSIITVTEGKCKWKEEEYIDFVGKVDMKCEYEIIWD